MTRTVHYRTTEVNGLEVFHREAGDPRGARPGAAPRVPDELGMFRNLIPALADRHRVIAPDHIGFGQSAMPAATDFPYTFDALTEVTAGLLEQLGVDRFAVYVQDYGAPIGWRLALADPRRITAVVSQSGNAYTEGFVMPFWDGLFAYAKDPNPETEAPVRGALTLEVTRWQYLNGVADPSLVSPDNWVHDQALLDRPGNAEIQLSLFRDYPRNVDMYPAVHQYFRDSQVPLLAVWGEHDEIFGPDGARAFRHDLPDAEVHLVESGHFALESHLEPITEYIRGFLDRVPV
ncbi:alpha/beta hydrolase [Streptomyces sp. NBC_00510]